MKNLLREPLLHFLLIGGLLFIGYAWINSGKYSESSVVHISAAEVDWLKETWVRQWSKQPSEQELQALVSHYLREELLMREARELGLEQDDIIVRRRLAQKMEFLIRDTALLTEPTEIELHELFKENATKYQTPATISFDHVYFKNESSAQNGLQQLLLERELYELGHSSLLANKYTQADKQAISNIFGPDFSTVVFKLEPELWHGPIVSSYGFHLVRINEMQAAQPKSFEDVQTQVLEEWQRVQQNRWQEKYFAYLLEKYDVIVDEEIGSLIDPITGIM